MEFVLEFKGHPIFVVMPCPAARPGKGYVIVGCHDPVNGDITGLCELSQLCNAVRHLLAGQFPLADDKFADMETQFRKFPQFLGLCFQFRKPFHHGKGHEHHFPLPADCRIQKAHGAGSQVPSVLVTLTIAVRQSFLQLQKIIGTDESLPAHHQTFLVGNVLWYPGNAADIVGDYFSGIPVTTGGSFNQFPVLVSQLDRQAVQF